MSGSLVDNAWFLAEFPGPVSVAETPWEDLGQSTEFAAEVEPFGMFVVRVTRMPVDAFLAVGAREWVRIFGDHRVAGFAEHRPEVVQDEAQVVVGGATRQLVAKIDYQGPCAVIMRVFAGPAGQEGRVVVASAVVDWSEPWRKTALQFLDSVQVRWAPPTTLPA